MKNWKDANKLIERMKKMMGNNITKEIQGEICNMLLTTKSKGISEVHLIIENGKIKSHKIESNGNGPQILATALALNTVLNTMLNATNHKDVKEMFEHFKDANVFNAESKEG